MWRCFVGSGPFETSRTIDPAPQYHTREQPESTIDSLLNKTIIPSLLLLLLLRLFPPFSSFTTVLLSTVYFRILNSAQMVKKEEPHKHIHICSECCTSTERNADSQCTLCVPHCSISVMSAVCSRFQYSHLRQLPTLPTMLGLKLHT